MVVAVPSWFFGEDVLIDAISIFVLALIAYFNIKYYKIKKNKKSLNLTVAFILLAISFTLNIFINSGVHYNIMQMSTLGYGKLALEDIGSNSSIVFITYFLYRAVTLIGLCFFYSIYEKQSKSNIFLLSFLIISLLYFSNSSYVMFHLGYFVILMLVTLQSIRGYGVKKYPATRLLVFSLGTITISQFSLLFAALDEKIYVAGELIQLVGYVALLITFIAVLIYGRKKDQNRYYW
ncbi:hypothetical protein HYT53_03605 [Candidatus Woesearchaeota archaeon]|nr:hypothetical protein [Candidatus Woesearchaeota archaeon]